MAVILTAAAFPKSAEAQDSLLLKNGDAIVGDVSKMDRNVLTIETSYSNADFNITWSEVSEFYGSERYNVKLVDNSQLLKVKINGKSPDSLKLEGVGISRWVKFDEVVYLKESKVEFLDKLSAGIDLGYSLTKAKNLQQYNASANLGYETDKWSLSGSYRQVLSEQDEVEPVRRIEAAAKGMYNLQSGIFFAAGLNFLSNSQQNLALRTTGTVGAGYYFVRSNSWYWTGMLGVAINNEDFEEVPEVDSPDRESYEGVISTELNLYDLGDLNLSTSGTWYPSFTETGRHRIDYTFNASYDLPLDFYINLGFTLNFDNQPVEGASQSDYVLLTGFGWSL